jgi:hypothetical protein
VEIGNTHPNLTSIYFIRLNLSQIVPETVPNSALLNTIAQTLGLHDYYQVGLWNFCEGDVGQGITDCSKPQSLYWFNPVEILLNELLAGATSKFRHGLTSLPRLLILVIVAIPSQFVIYLKILRLASQVMFGLLLTGLLLCFLVGCLVPYFRRGFSMFLVSLGTLLACLCTVIASLIGTAIFQIMAKAATGVAELNIGAKVGEVMLALMWTASISSFVAFICQSAACCCCRERRKKENPKTSELC